MHERAQLTVEEYRTVEVEGLHFLESMGFMLDNLNFRNLAPDAQEQTFQRIPSSTRCARPHRRPPRRRAAPTSSSTAPAPTPAAWRASWRRSRTP